MNDKSVQVMGRPEIYTPELAKLVCDAIENTPRGLEYICGQNKNFPTGRTVRNWLKNIPDFFPMYARAKALQAHRMADEAVEVSNDSEKDWRIIIDSEGNEKEVFVAESVNRSRLKVDTLKWMTEILEPKIYGVKKLEKDATSELAKEIIVDTMKELADKCLQSQK